MEWSYPVYHETKKGAYVGFKAYDPAAHSVGDIDIDRDGVEIRAVRVIAVIEDIVAMIIQCFAR